jgi:tetratricopeptide (TPR) repeat protein
VGRHFVALAIASAVLLGHGIAGADADQQRRDHDAKVAAEVAAVSSEAAVAFAAGDAARERGDVKAAAEAYRRARTLAPLSPHPLRRLCWAEGGLGERDSALSHCREAVAMDASAPNLGALAMALMLPPGSTIETPRADRLEALQLAQRAARLDVSDISVHIVLCQAALSLDDVPALRTGVERLSAIAPQHMMTHYFVTIVHGHDARWSEANAALDRAAAAGLPKQEVRRLRQILHDAQPFWRRRWPLIVVAIIGFATLLALYVLIRRLVVRAKASSSHSQPAGDGVAPVRELTAEMEDKVRTGGKVRKRTPAGPEA